MLILIDIRSIVCSYIFGRIDVSICTFVNVSKYIVICQNHFTAIEDWFWHILWWWYVLACVWIYFLFLYLFLVLRQPSFLATLTILLYSLENTLLIFFRQDVFIVFVAYGLDRIFWNHKKCGAWINNIFCRTFFTYKNKE